MLKDLLKTETKVLIALASQRSSHYGNCLINHPDYGKRNGLKFTKDKKQFTFLDYKNIIKTGYKYNLYLMNKLLISI